jgi:hypothetical protein
MITWKASKTALLTGQNATGQQRMSKIRVS